MIFGLSYRYFTKKPPRDLRALSILGIMFFLLNISNGNFAFYVSLGILLSIFNILLIIISRKNASLYEAAKKLTLYYIVLSFSTAWSIAPQTIEMYNLLSRFNSGESAFNLKDWILWQALSFSNLFFINVDIMYYVQNISPAVLFSICLFLTLTLTLIVNKHNSLSLIFMFVLLFDIFLLNKGLGLLNENTIWAIFKNPPLNSLRSYEKTSLYIPFFVIIIIANNLKQNVYKYKYLSCLLLSISFISIYPIFTGEMQTIYSSSYDQKFDYLSAPYSSLVKIPADYFDLAQNDSQNCLDYKLYYMPYAVINSIGWINYPKWKAVGADPTMQLFNRPVIQMNTPSAFGSWNYGSYWSNQDANSSLWIMNLASLLNVRYIVFHKDVEDIFIKESKEKISFYNLHKSLILLKKNSYFDLYKLNSNLFIPHFYIPKIVITSKGGLKQLPELLSFNRSYINYAIYLEKLNKPGLINTFDRFNISHVDGGTRISQDQNNRWDNLFINKKYPMFDNIYFRNNSGDKIVLEFRKINPTKYRLRVHNATDPFLLIFSETFHFGWVIYAKDYEETPIDISFLSNYKLDNLKEDAQASRSDIIKFINRGWLSCLAKSNEKTKAKEIGPEYFVSKNIRGTIQNDNLPDGKFYETWFNRPLNNNENHYNANGYANSWIIDPKSIYREGKAHKNTNGSYDLELIVEFWPQQIYYIGLFISALTMLICTIVFFILYFASRLKNSLGVEE